MKQMSHFKKMMIGLLMVSVVAVSAVSATAAANEIKLVINGKTVTTKDGNGKALQPVTIDGTVYIPAQSVSEALGMELNWNSGTKEVRLSDKTAQPASDASGYIGAEKAKQIALSHAGVTASAADFFRAELDVDDNRAQYEIEFYSGSVEYDYDIDAKSGKIVSWDREAEGYTIPSKNNSTVSNTEISMEQAKALAKAKAPSATLSTCKLDYENGKKVYEGELRSGRTEYSFEIDAANGNFLKWEVDYDD